MVETYLIVGLGNPGSRYTTTRHNVGFKVAERIAERFNLNFRAGRGDYLISNPKHKLDEKAQILLLKPLTFMNNSGSAVRHAVDYFDIALPKVLVIFDEFQLPLGKLRLRPSGSDGGHNGMASVIQHLGTQEVARLRVGIGSEFELDNAVDYVLSSFSLEEQKQLPAIFDRAADAAINFGTDGIENTMNQFNS
jgi:PTH1 family peptidyl-tRNA hydrolase